MQIENPTLDLLIEILEVSDYWHILDLLDDVQDEIIQSRFINPSTLRTSKS